ncbi:hypothetical protein MNBD_ALPHA11-541 [hydrothermal vent metagenome]|uniref:Uncharacterized protein n=1 Tax=hydrothermal vent metagenome TaxID=652676 RepID=A0A3B0TA74_9ZZZZ
MKPIERLFLSTHFKRTIPPKKTQWNDRVERQAGRQCALPQYLSGR